ncbi:polyphosphate kinase 1 [Chrysiogenes arsenatis]|uniref:polyphosphate kinase 1 n=1 Tax=Chrysiogenes arsenatis TaxID=309797 RepID=UPI0004165B98|nr:polyphosphate kinase 1 [Chrysiogenes arsenatis]
MQPPMEYPYINREISWLSFNDRVLQEATDPENPVMERLKFLGIFSSNLDEFFRVRVATMKRLLALGERAQELIGSDPKVILATIRNRVMRQQDRFEKIYAAVLEELAESGIFLVDETTLDEAQQQFVVQYFRSTVRPALVPVMLDQVASAPRVNDGMIYFAILMRNSNDPDDEQRAVMKIPPADTIPRFLVLPSASDRHCIILLDDIIRFCLSEIFALFDYDRFDAYTFKITRDAELDLEDKVMISYIETLSESLKERKRGKPVRMVYDREMPLELLEALDDKLEWSDELTKIPSGRYHNFKDFMGFPKVGDKSLYFEPFPAIPHPAISPRQSIMRIIRERDIVLHFPYQPFYHVIDLLREAAIDPKVTSIKMTLYRLASNSNVANALVNAVRNGKEVVVVIELQARFDEKANISWARKFKDNNVRVIYGVPGLKVHSKLLHITRTEGENSVCYSGIGTGNFNESTAKVYGDDILLTADSRITEDVGEVFRFLEDNAYEAQPKHILMAPFTMRPRFEALLQREVDNARLGKEAWCSLKLNSLVDREMVKRLYEAGEAGVKIRLIIRGICSLVPGKRGVSDNIQAISIVDRFLEHSRLFFFANGGNPEAFMGSADWMRRNLSNRVEVITPIYDSTLRQELYDMFELQWNDNTKARLLSGRQANRYRGTAQRNCRRAQFEIYRYIFEKNLPTEDNPE